MKVQCFTDLFVFCLVGKRKEKILNVEKKGNLYIY